MADLKISQLPALSSTTDTDEVPIVQGGVTDKATITQLRTGIVGGANIADLADVITTSPATDDVLRFNGTDWVNSSPGSAGSSPGIVFYNSTPVINSVTQPGGLSQDGTAGNGIQINSLSKTPITTAEQTAAGTAVSDTRAFAAWLYNTALGRTTLDAGVWRFSTYCAVNSVAAGRVTTLTRQIYQVQVPASGTISVTGVGANSRTFTASAGTPFASTGFFAPSATNTTASYIKTPAGIFQITARTSDTVVTCTVPTGYSNESTVAYTVWNKLFGSTSTAITATGTNYTLAAFNSTQSSFTVAATDKLGAISFVTSNNTTTLTLTYDGTAHNTSFETPLITLHNNLAGLQGGTSNEFYHITAAQNTVVGNTSGTNTGDQTDLPIVASPSAGSVSGVKITLTSTETQIVGDACNIDSNGKAHLAKADAIANANTIVMAAHTVTNSASNTYLTHGVMRLASSPSWTVGGLIYLSTTGTSGNTLTQTAPSGANNVIQILGVAIAADTMIFNPSLVQVEHV